MTNQEAWNILGIMPTNDKRAIRRAYAAKSREHHAEEEPEQFARIHEAYQKVLDGVNSDDNYSEMLYNQSQKTVPDAENRVNIQDGMQNALISCTRKIK